MTGRNGTAIVRAIVAGERDPVRFAALRDRRCRKSETEFAEYLTGNWRSEHLFNLESALHLYDETQRMITSYEARLLDELQALEPDPRRDRPVPEHPNSVKEKAIRKCGEHPVRTTLWRFAGVDLTRIDGIGEQAYAARFQRQRLASINAAAQSFGYALIEKDTASGRINIINDL